MNILDLKLSICSRHYKKILKFLRVRGATSRLIGGCVRDAILGKDHYDIDIATTLLPEQVINILQEANIKVVPTGIKFGTVSAFFQEEKFEITTLRKDLGSDGRRPQAVFFSESFEEDAARRDFTINALSYCPFEHKIYDYFTGIEDLKNLKVKFIGDPEDRIKEDFLRILRFFRFSCYYALHLDPKGLEASIKLKDHLKTLSKERIKQEMDKLIASDNSMKILQQMADNGVLQVIFPIEHFDFQIFANAIEYAKNIKIKLEELTRYALLFIQANNIVPEDLISLKFSKKEVIGIFKIINTLYTLLPASPSNHLFQLKKIWLRESNYLQHIVAALACNKLNLELAQEFIAKYNMIKKPRFPITGHDLMKISHTNKTIGRDMQLLNNIWIESNFSLNKKQLLMKLKNGN